MGCGSSRGDENRKPLKILMLGLDDAGKTSILYSLVKKSNLLTTPTFGFNVETIIHNPYEVTIWDMGGSFSIRQLWGDYFFKAHGIVFVVDSATRDQERWVEAQEALAFVLDHKNLQGIPIIVLANKQDKVDVLSHQEILDVLGLSKIENRVCAIQSTSALNGQGLDKAMDTIVRLGIKMSKKHL